MPKVIKLKRGDVSSLNYHVLQDGEPAFTRNRVLESGPQAGETTRDHYFRVGDGETPGGIVPGATTIGVGIQYAITAASNALKMIEDLSGSHWTAWKTEDFIPPYLERAGLEPEPVSCLTPDILNYSPNIHLGYGYVMFDGTAFELKMRDKPFRFLSDLESKTERVLAGSAFWTIHTISDSSNFETRPKKYGVRVWTVCSSDSSGKNIDLCGIESSVSNYYSSDSSSPVYAGSCFLANIDNQTPPTNVPYCTKITYWFGYRCAKIENPRYTEANPEDSRFIRCFTGFYIQNQDSTAVSGNSYGFRAHVLNSGYINEAGNAGGRGKDHYDDISTHVGYGVTRLVDGNKIGVTARTTTGFSIRYLGVGEDEMAQGAYFASGIYILNVGSIVFTDQSYGCYFNKIHSCKTAMGIYINEVSGKSTTGEDTYAYGVRCDKISGSVSYDTTARGISLDLIEVNKGVVTGLHVNKVHHYGGTNPMKDELRGLYIREIKHENQSGISAFSIEGVYLHHIVGETIGNIYGIRLGSIENNGVGGCYSFYYKNDSTNLVKFQVDLPSESDLGNLSNGDWYIASDGCVKIKNS